ncbi:serine hydrolase [Propionibacteriaceae bacterium Y2011]
MRPEEAVPGSGVCQHLDPGLSLTLGDLATLMIMVSDNWATDLVIAQIGKTAVADTARRLGLDSTRFIFTMREMFCARYGLDSDNPTLTPAALARLVDTIVTPPAGETQALPPDNVSTPADMTTLLPAIHAGRDLPGTSHTALVASLRRQTNRTIIPARLPAGTVSAHKTGKSPGVANDVGIVETPSRSFAIAFLSEGLTDVSEAMSRMAWASRWIWDLMSCR